LKQTSYHISTYMEIVKVVVEASALAARIFQNQPVPDVEVPASVVTSSWYEASCMTKSLVVPSI